MHLIQLISKLSAKEILLNSAILAAVFRGIWSGFSEISNRLRHRFSSQTQPYRIALGPYHPEFDEKVASYCLIIRYGTDGYIQGLATERDRFDGRLQNKKIPIVVERTEEGAAHFSLSLPVHKRIGTQFKLFAEIPEEENLEDIKQTLMSCCRIYDISKSSSQFKNRLYFLLKDFGTCKSVDGIKNNICFPE